MEFLIDIITKELLTHLWYLGFEQAFRGLRAI